MFSHFGKRKEFSSEAIPIRNANCCGMPWPHWLIAAARRCIMRLPILLTIVAVKRAGRPSRYSRTSVICWIGDFQLHGEADLAGLGGAELESRRRAVLFWVESFR